MKCADLTRLTDDDLMAMLIEQLWALTVGNEQRELLMKELFRRRPDLHPDALIDAIEENDR